ncbi:MAG: DUF4197 domain-containing protein [Flavobacterium sp.]|nr:DUF4197 domain-containing protein [Flavobacterium sp.]
MKKIVAFALCIPFLGCTQIRLPSIKLPNSLPTGVVKIDIAGGLKEALNQGITKQVTKLTAIDGFYRNELVKILLPEELQKVDRTLRKFGMSNLADEGLLLLNRAAEDAVKQSTPIFVDAIKNIKFADAKTILFGSENAATTYLQGATNMALYAKFNPVIRNSLSNVGADALWTNLITKYNAIPLVIKINPDLTDYVTNQALAGVFKMITVEEKNIRTDLKSRTSALLQNVFRMQDKK